jgi:hypothetical protein
MLLHSVTNALYILGALVILINNALLTMTNDFIILHRCLCELAKQIGFQEQAQDAFILQQQLSTFRHVVSKRKHLKSVK